MEKETLKEGDKVYLVNYFHNFQTGIVQKVDIIKCWNNNTKITYDILTDGECIFNFHESECEEGNIFKISNEYRNGEYENSMYPFKIVSLYTPETVNIAIEKMDKDIEHNKMMMEKHMEKKRKFIEFLKIK